MGQLILISNVFNISFSRDQDHLLRYTTDGHICELYNTNIFN